MSMKRHLVESALGLFCMAHALAHAVLPVRGALGYPWGSGESILILTTYTLAQGSLFTAGLGLIGARPLRPTAPILVWVGLVSSVALLLLRWDPSAWWGLAIDAALAGAFIAAWNLGFLSRSDDCDNVRHGRLSRWLANTVFFGLLAYVVAGSLLWPWHRHWGASRGDMALRLPGDAPDRNPAYELMHAVTIDAPPEVVWSWLVQLGQDRAGFYSYDGLERLFGIDVHNIFQRRPEWQQRAVGDVVPATQPGYFGGLFGNRPGWRITHLEPHRAIVLENWGAFVLEPASDNKTRFLIRSSMGGPKAPVWGAAVMFAFFELPHFIMGRKMMLTIKRLSEAEAG
jgi:hypothetical protein